MGGNLERRLGKNGCIFGECKKTSKGKGDSSSGRPGKSLFYIPKMRNFPLHSNPLNSTDRHQITWDGVPKQRRKIDDKGKLSARKPVQKKKPLHLKRDRKGCDPGKGKK